MRKLSALFLSAALIVLGGCSASGGGKSSAASSSAVSSSAAEESTEPAASEQTPEPEEEITYTPGTVSGSVYKCPTLGLSADLTGWVIGSEEELMEMGNFDEPATPEKRAAVMAEKGSVMDLYTYMPDSSANINLQIQDLSGDPSTLGYSEKEICDLIRGSVEEGLLKAGYDEVTVESTSEMFAGEEHGELLIYGTFKGIELYQKEMAIRNGSYLGLITFTARDEAAVNEAMKMFSKIGG